MIENILQMLEIAKEQKQIGKYTHLALGKNKLPQTLQEAYKQFKLELCQ